MCHADMILFSNKGNIQSKHKKPVLKKKPKVPLKLVKESCNFSHFKGLLHTLLINISSIEVLTEGKAYLPSSTLLLEMG